MSWLRSVGALLLCGFTVSGCGIALRPVTVAGPDGPRQDVPTAVIDARPNPVFPPSGVLPVVLAPGQTVVTLTFDDGRVSNGLAARLMSNHGLFGTFFINSGNIGLQGYLSLQELDRIAMAGHEIAGHTLKHRDLAKLSAEEVRHQVCDDRKALLTWGYHVTDFAYPFAVASSDIEQIVRDCGYNSGRSLGELKTIHVPENAQAGACAACSWAEVVPPPNLMYTKAPAQVRSNWTLDEMKAQVTAATTGNGTPTSGDGGWVQLTFHGICPSDCSDIGVSEDVFDQFLTWLADEQAQGHLIVRTVDDVIGGPLQP